MGKEMKEYTVQVQICAVVDLTMDVYSLESAIEKGNQEGWSDLFLDRVVVNDGSHRVVGVWENGWKVVA